MESFPFRRRALTLCAAAITAALTVAGVASASNSPLSGYWSMNEGHGQTIRDSSGQHNDGTIGSTKSSDKHDSQWVRGVLGLGSALRLDGNDFAVMPETSSLRPQKVTVGAWVRTAKAPGRFKYVVVKGGDRCEAGSFGLYTANNGGMAFYVYDGKHWFRSPSASPSMWDGRWHNVVGSYDGKAVRVYVDGREVGNGTKFKGKINYNLPNRPAYIGAYRGGCDLTFAGDVDEVSIWSDAVSPHKVFTR
jgi:hypothetical protein